MASIHNIITLVFLQCTPVKIYFVGYSMLHERIKGNTLKKHLLKPKHQGETVMNSLYSKQHKNTTWKQGDKSI